MSKIIIESLLNKIPLDTMMLVERHIYTVQECLLWTLYKRVSGDVVELGCNRGNMAIYTQSILRAKSANKSLHVYDSFEGLPPHSAMDESPDRTAKKGDLGATVQELLDFFERYNVPCPLIHKGWFKDQKYPDKISFAFLDGDFYQSILDSWEAVYPRLSDGAIVCVHDYGFNPLVGVKRACDEFLADKPHLMFWDDYVATYIF
ncbi:MAG: TylF/MycF/NovP-related O-methyltransferase [Parcubacteria group bacterium]|jgi:O-methyltransferase